MILRKSKDDIDLDEDDEFFKNHKSLNQDEEWLHKVLYNKL